MFDALSNQLNVKYYYNYSTNKKVFTPPVNLSSYQLATRMLIVTEDGLPYGVSYHTDNSCKSRLEVNEQKSTDDVMKDFTCMFVSVNVEGEKKNSIMCNDKQNLNNLNGCNTIRFVISKDGITAGNPDCTIAGRIMSDNITYDENKCK